MNSKFSIDNRELLQKISSGEAAAGVDFGNAIVRELAAFRLAAMDSEPVCFVSERNLATLTKYRAAVKVKAEPVMVRPVALYRHAQQPVVPDDVLDALQKVARIRLDLNGFDGDRRGIADCLCDAEEALIEVVNRRAAMLQGAENAESRCNTKTTPALDSSSKNADSRCGNSPAIPDRWIPVRERMPESNGVYFGWDGQRVLEVNCFFGGWSANQFIHGEITHWMPLPSAPQEVQGE
ncbi:DUF551 domain-containing protein [Klebsiella pneumoniae subsp. pneumoniae]|uniref:DUF551 domain-containing protein n=1 Tax=Klebsiella pneumoniae TaxID=573 RepID=UPI000CEBEC1C|nr:DUF551 domain-containing protein [Klebsiella pneumoniae]ROE12647.1 DUF551 domain-containing protein [Klebsiella pneumoniae subsp. pneumoniae]ROE14302.1 DUF551 domain-containing protein [Klebsiella pneumoniae subsp. pneumoniae]